jgi:ATP-dependent helicase HrpA
MILNAADLHKRIDQCMQAERHRLRRRVKAVAGKVDSDPKALSLLNDIERSITLCSSRRDNAPKPNYPDELPVVQQRDAIMDALAKHQVIIVCGETGSGKTTQLPKMCLEFGLGASGFIGHTQPRRIAARSVSSRIASELGSTVGEAVGFKIRFSDLVGEQTYIKLMTDGILLAEIQRDPFLNGYDAIIIDEAHERSLNIDFLLGYLKTLLPKRRDLKLIITSATIDPERFSRHFNNAPIIFAEGRTYPVELRYEPPETDTDSLDDIDLPTAIVNACETLIQERSHDVLVFLPGERDIRELADLFSKTASSSRHLRGVEVVPLFSRLSNAEQNRIFQKHTKPRIVLATNVAETSLTVPGIRSVVDAGYARMSRYSVRSKVQRLPIEKISQASANQRMGRCGREAPGICIRLYSEEDFLARPEFTEPEILRTNLSSVILQMSSMRLGQIDSFPFVEAPDAKFINDGYRTLQELAALDNKRKLTPLGKRLSRLPVDPRLGRMLLAAENEGCVSEMLIIVSALSVQDPRERPFEKRAAADEMHAEFNDEKSDFMAWLNVWAFLSVQKERLSNSQFRKMCKQRFISPLRVIEWMDVRVQLQRLCKELKIKLNTEDAAYENIHRALLTGLLANVAVKSDKNDYLGTRNRHLSIFPGSGLFKKGPKWMMAAEIAETSKLYARQVASIDSAWVERLAEHLLSRTYRDAHWQKKTGTVGAYEQSTLYGLIVNPKKRVNYSPINPTESRQIFIRDGLVAGGLKSSGDFYRHNIDLLDEVTTLEEKSRRRDIVVDPEEMVRFYEAIIPDDVCTSASFEQFRKTYEADNPRGLYFSRDMLLADESASVSSHDYPDQMEFGGMVLPLRYHFAPGEDDDGVTLVAPVEVINRIPKQQCDWLVPGLIHEKVTLLIKSLPKTLRRNFVPAPDFAKNALQKMHHGEGVLTTELSRQLHAMTGVDVPRGEWGSSNLPLHLQMRFQLVDGKGKTVKAGRDLAALQEAFSDQVEETLLQASSNSIERDSITDWNFGDLPESVDIEQNSITLQGYPALHAVDGTVAIKLFASESDAHDAMPAGLRLLFRHVLRDEIKYLQRRLPGIDVLSLRFAPFGNKEILIDDIIDAALDHVFILGEPWPRSREQFYARLESNRSKLVACAGEFCEATAAAFEQHRVVAKRIEGSISLGWVEAVGDIKDQIAQLLYPGFVTNTGLARMKRMGVYFQAMDKRLTAIDKSPDKDRARRAELLPVWETFKQLPDSRDNDLDYAQAHNEIRWLFEELRISLFAQELGTREKVSVARLESRLAKLQP